LIHTQLTFFVTPFSHVCINKWKHVQDFFGAKMTQLRLMSGHLRLGKHWIETCTFFSYFVWIHNSSDIKISQIESQYKSIALLFRKRDYQVLKAFFRSFLFERKFIHQVFVYNLTKLINGISFSYCYLITERQTLQQEKSLGKHDQIVAVLSKIMECSAWLIPTRLEYIFHVQPLISSH